MARGNYGFAELPFVLDEIHVMQADILNQTFMGDIVSAGGPQRLGFTGETHNPEAEVGGTTFRYATLLRRYNVSLELLGVDIQMHKVLTDGIETLNATNTQRNFYIPIGGTGGLPFVGLFGFGATDDGGAFAVAVPQMKLSNVPGFDMTGSSVEYSTGSMDGMALPSQIGGAGSQRFAVAIRLFDNYADLVLPTDAAGFKALFTSALTTVPGAPAAPKSFAKTATSITVVFLPPTLTGGNPLTGFAVQYRQGTSGAFTEAANPVAGGAAIRTYVITGLTSGQSYEIQVAALNALGLGAWSPSLTISTS